MNIPVPDDKLTQIADAPFQHRKIDATKLYRNSTGVGLAEAKSAVEKVEQKLKESAREKFTGAQKANGCLGLDSVGCALASAVWWKVRIYA